MIKRDLSILIPARNEMFLAKTVENILQNIEGNTEIIIVLDGTPADPPVPDHERVRIVTLSKSIGQRAATNMAARLSNAKYVAKCDAHCAFDKGFDVKMIAEMHDDWTMVPLMRNLHAFNWVCNKCGSKWFQSPTPECCYTQAKDWEKQVKNEKCDGTEFYREIVWKPNKNRPRSKAYRFDTDMHFQYDGRWADMQEGDITSTMSLQGSFFMMTRQKYWELNICDEAFGSWGQQGVEVACKTWLSGGQVMCNRKTWYAHMFRTQGGDFGMPFPLSQRAVQHARDFSKDLFLKNKWPLAKHKLQWMFNKFKPEGWPTKGIIYYTDNQLNLKIAHKVQKQLKKMELPIVSSSLKPMTFGDKNIVLPLKRGSLTMFKQILAALEALDTDIVYFCEHDVLYHPSHFDFTPEKKDKFYYNQNFWKVWPDGFVAHWDANQVSGLCCYREHAIEFYKKRIQEVEKEFNRSYEPGGRDKSLYEVWKSEYPNIDIRHDNNLTNSHKSPDRFRDKSTCVNWQDGGIDLIQGWDRSVFDGIIR